MHRNHFAHTVLLWINLKCKVDGITAFRCIEGKEYLLTTFFSGQAKVLLFISTSDVGVPVLAQWLTNPTRNDGVVGSTPGLAQWVKDLALP